MASSLQHLLEGHIDFVAQKKIENITHVSLIVITIVSFILGFSLQSLLVTFASFGVSFSALMVVIVPPWPSYNKYAVNWLPNKETKKVR